MLDDIDIRKAGKADAEGVSLLIRELAAHEGTSSEVSFSVEDLEQALAGDPPKLHALVAVDASGMLGFVSYTIDFTIWTGSETVRVDDVFVKSGARGAGVGRRLMSRVAEVAVARGATARWEVEPENIAAQRFYERLGVFIRKKLVARWSLEAMSAWVAAGEGNAATTLNGRKFRSGRPSR
jgi:ribosomal protein S18 acetylase RimI-like enzyme